jgi:SAM-dependent methyltransferase
VTFQAPERIRWALDLLDVQPQDRILEIGCGPGAAAALICPRLAGGHLTAIDRSAVAILRSVQRNAAQLNAGVVDFQLAELAGFDAGGRVFDKIFAVNVNLFWVRSPARELELLRTLMHLDSTLHLVYEFPAESQSGGIAEQIAAAFTEHGFSTDVLTGPEPSLQAVTARLRP